jgi:predicted nuclease of predicted toxin-antitoxin system
MKFLVDAQMPPQLATWLRARGHEAVAAREVGLGDVIVTKDEDFAELAARSDTGPQVLWVRTGNLVNKVLLERFAAAWPEAEPLLAAGARLVELR